MSFSNTPPPLHSQMELLFTVCFENGNLYYPSTNPPNLVENHNIISSRIVSLIHKFLMF